jgi:uncharacterized protein with GYD domain
MATYLMFGKYTAEALKGISAGRTAKAAELINKLGGKVLSQYALLGEKDLVLIVDFPTTDGAMKASIEISKLTGIGFSTSPAVPVDAFDQMV